MGYLRSFLHENWNKDLRLFSDGEDGGQKLLQVDPYAKSMNFRKWPLFADWEEIFGNDRTTRQFVEGPEDVEEIGRIEAQEVANNMSLEFSIIVVDEDDALAEGEDQIAQEKT